MFYRLFRVEMTSSGCAWATHRFTLSFALPQHDEQFDSCDRMREVNTLAVHGRTLFNLRHDLRLRSERTERPTKGTSCGEAGIWPRLGRHGASITTAPSCV